MSTIGIYKITNKINGKAYIGQSINIEKRWIDHKKSYNNKKDSATYNYPIYRAFRKYGINNFDFEIIEECSREELNEKEKYWIEFHNSCFNGYNQTLGGNASLQIPKEYVKNILEDLKNPSLSIKQISIKYNVSTDTVYDINDGKTWYQNNIDYPIKILKKNMSEQERLLLKKINRCNICNNIISLDAVICVECYKKEQAKNIPSKEQLIEKILIYPMITIGKFYKVSATAVVKWCKKYGLPYKRKDIIEFRNKYNNKGDD